MNYTWMEIDLEAIAYNYQCVRKQLEGKAEIIAVVKANAYGLGAVPIAKRLEKAGCKHFAVTYFEEALELREAGVKAEILVMMPVEPEEALQAVAQNLTTAMGDLDHATRVSEILTSAGKQLKMHVKVDSGLSRMGIVLKNRLEEAAKEVQAMAALPGFMTEGIFTHLTAASPTGEYGWLDDYELQLFEQLTAALEAGGLKLRKHNLCSDPLLCRKEEKCDFVRIGTLLYGVNPGKYSSFGVKNCLTLKSRVVQVKEIPADTPISYGPWFVTEKPTRIAVVAFGFSDGLRRALSNVGEMLVKGRRARIVGKICCDHTILDVSSIPEVKEGDIVTVFGKDGEEEQFAGEYAALIKASEPETTSILATKIPHIYQ